MKPGRASARLRQGFGHGFEPDDLSAARRSDPGELGRGSETGAPEASVDHVGVDASGRQQDPVDLTRAELAAPAEVVSPAHVRFQPEQWRAQGAQHDAHRGVEDVASGRLRPLRFSEQVVELRRPELTANDAVAVVINRGQAVDEGLQFPDDSLGPISSWLAHAVAPCFRGLQVGGDPERNSHYGDIA